MSEKKLLDRVDKSSLQSMYPEEFPLDTETLLDVESYATETSNLGLRKKVTGSRDLNFKLLLDSDFISLLSDYNSIFVGFSGGLDSTVLLHHVSRIPILKKRLSAVHVNHGLSPYADVWQDHCEIFCKNLNIPLNISQVNIDSKSNIEERARKARYNIFESLLKSGDAILLAHHKQDQSETLLLHLFRGTGVDGLAAMPLIRPLAKGYLVRPLLHFSRELLVNYAKINNLSFINDESNDDINFSRNYIRNKILPIICEKWPNAVNSLAACAINCQDASKNLEALAAIDYIDIDDNELCLSIDKLPLHDNPRLINILRTWLKKNGIRSKGSVLLEKLINEVILASKDAQPCITCENVTLSRYKNKLYILDKNINNVPKNIIWSDFPSPCVLKYGKSLQAQISPDGISIPNGSNVEVRYRHGGELLRLNGQTKHLKKLFQQWGVPPWLRSMIPLIYVNNNLKAVVGFVITNQDDDLLDTKSKYTITYRDELCHNL